MKKYLKFIAPLALIALFAGWGVMQSRKADGLRVQLEKAKSLLMDEENQKLAAQSEAHALRLRAKTPAQLAKRISENPKRAQGGAKAIKQGEIAALGPDLMDLIIVTPDYAADAEACLDNIDIYRKAVVDYRGRNRDLLQDLSKESKRASKWKTVSWVSIGVVAGAVVFAIAN